MITSLLLAQQVITKWTPNKFNKNFKKMKSVTQSYQLIRQEAHLGGSSRCYLSLLTISMPKTRRYPLTISRVIDDHGILQSYWTRGTTDCTQPKVVASDVTFT